MAELLPCPFCGSTDLRYDGYWCCSFNGFYVRCLNCDASATPKGTKRAARKAWNTRTPKERGADKTKITCLNCKHLMFSDMYGECNKQLKIVNPSDTCEYAEPKERGGENV